ncbi:hypothetical protein ACFFMN_23470 [Planobispora siamensis]|nr:hypothetical protein [Planobispora siamensis]
MPQARDLRTSIDRAIAYGDALGYATWESDTRDIDNAVMVDFTGHGQLIEAHYRVDPDTGYLRFDYGFVHGGTSGDRVSTWVRLSQLLELYAAPEEEDGEEEDGDDAAPAQ